MPTATAADVRSQCNLDPTVEDVMLAPHLATAADDVERLLGSSRYSAVATPVSPFVAADRARLVAAEALLAGAIALPFLNLQSSGKGVVKTLLVGPDGRQSEFLSEREVQAKAVGWRSIAMGKLARYVPPATDADLAIDDVGLTLGSLRLTPLGGG